MAINYRFTVFFTFFFATVCFSSAVLVEEQPLVLKYHNGVLLKGNITVSLVCYGKFTPIQGSVIVDFIHSLSSKDSASSVSVPSVASWWKTKEKYKKGLCMNRCGTHGTSGSKSRRAANGAAYVWVGNSETQCPGYCAWPFHQPIYRPQTPPLIAPNGDVGFDGIIINLATLLANTVTNPFNNGYFQGPPTALLEAVSASPGIFGSGSGYAGRVLVNKTAGSSYNARGLACRKCRWDPQSSTCRSVV